MKNIETFELQFERTPKAISFEGLARAVMSPVMIAVIWICAALHIFTTLPAELPQRQRSFDFAAYYVGALILREGGNPYATNGHPVAARLDLDPGEIDTVVDTPALLLSFEPLTWFAPVTAYWMWTVLNVGLLAASLLMLLGPGSGYRVRGALLVAGLVLLYPPLKEHFFYAQTQLVILFLFVVAMRSMGRQRDALAGTALALAALLRGYPLIVLGYLAVRRRRRTLGFAIAALGIAGLLTVVAVGVRSCVDFLSVARMANTAFFYRRPDLAINASVARVVLLLWGPGSWTGPIRGAAVALIESVILAITIRASYIAAPAPDREWRAFSLWVVACVVLSPIVWVHYMILFVILFAQLGVATEQGTASRRALEMAAASFLLILSAIVVQSGTWASSGVSYAVAALSTGSMLTAYLSAYWFATDSTGGMHADGHSVASVPLN